MAELKCPWQTITRTIVGCYGESKSYVEFADCLKNECPYYGKTVLQRRENGGWETVTQAMCRRAENG
jgi:hypothetical protein